MPRILASLLILFLSTAAFAHDWTSFRGPNTNGHSTEGSIFPGFDGPFHLEIGWKIELGSGYAGVVVADGRAITISAEGEHNLLAAYDVADGKRLWSFELGKFFKGYDGAHDGPISTPLIADGRVFALDPLGRFVAVSAESGELLWETHLADDHAAKMPHYGFAGSPILVGGSVIIGLGAEGKTVAALDPASGEVRWTAGDDKFSYQTPIPARIGERPGLVVASDKEIYGLSTTGEVIWSHRHDGVGARGAGSLTPVATSYGQYFLAHKDDGSLLIGVDSGDSGRGEANTVRVLWESRSLRNSYSVPVHYDGRIYGYNSRILTSVDAGTGEAVWRSRKPGDGFLLIAERRLIIATKTGSVHIANLASKDGYDELASIEVFDEHLWTPPSLSDGSLYVRSLGGLARIDIVPGAASSEQVAQGEGAFAAFLASLEAAGQSNREELIDAWIEKQESFPVIEGNQAHFIYRGDADDVALGGDMFGARREEPMKRASGTTLFHRTVELESDARLNYLYIENFADQVRDALNPRQTTTTFMKDDMEMYFGDEELPMSWMSMPDWKEPAHLAPAPEGHRGKLVEHEIDAKSLGEDKKATVTVYLPPGYDDSGETKYPIAYHHDGKKALERGAIANSLDHLIGKSVEPVIVAFVDVQAQGPEVSRGFLLDVVPFLDAEYPLLEDRMSRAHLGNAFGAANAFLITAGHSDRFGVVGMQSPYLFTQLEQAVHGVIDGLEGEDLTIYLEWGKYDLRNPHEAWGMAEAGRNFAAALKDKNLDFTGGEVNDGTGWSSWRLRTDRLFEALFPLSK